MKTILVPGSAEWRAYASTDEILAYVKEQTALDLEAEDVKAALRWRAIVTEAMLRCIEKLAFYDRPNVDSWVVEQLVRAGFSLAEIREHFDDVKRRLDPK